MTIRRAAFGAALLLVGAAAGAAGARWLAPRDAHADERPTTTTIYVGSQGLVFRGTDGRMVAKLSSDAHGGVFDLCDAQEQPRTRLRATGLEVVSTGGSVPAPPPPPVAPPPVHIAPNRYARPPVDLGF